MKNSVDCRFAPNSLSAGMADTTMPERTAPADRGWRKHPYLLGLFYSLLLWAMIIGSVVRIF